MGNLTNYSDINITVTVDPVNGNSMYVSEIGHNRRLANSQIVLLLILLKVFATEEMSVRITRTWLLGSVAVWAGEQGKTLIAALVGLSHQTLDRSLHLGLRAETIVTYDNPDKPDSHITFGDLLDTDFFTAENVGAILENSSIANSNFSFVGAALNSKDLEFKPAPRKQVGFEQPEPQKDEDDVGPCPYYEGYDYAFTPWQRFVGWLRRLFGMT